MVEIALSVAFMVCVILAALALVLYEIRQHLKVAVREITLAIASEKDAMVGRRLASDELHSRKVRDIMQSFEPEKFVPAPREKPISHVVTLGPRDDPQYLVQHETIKDLRRPEPINDARNDYEGPGRPV